MSVTQIPSFFRTWFEDVADVTDVDVNDDDEAEDDDDVVRYTKHIYIRQRNGLAYLIIFITSFLKVDIYIINFRGKIFQFISQSL